MNRLDHIRIGVDVVLDARDRLRVLEQALHLGLGAAVAQLQVVQHGVILLGKPLIGRLDRGHVGTHLVGVVRHIRNGHVRILDRLFRVPAKGRDQACRERRDCLHVLVGRKARRLVRAFGILLQFPGGVLEQGVDTADQLLIIRKSGDDLFAQLHCGGTCGNEHRTHGGSDRFQNVAEALELALGILGGVPCFVDLVAHVVCAVGDVVHLPVHAIQRILGPTVSGVGFIQGSIVIGKLTFHVVEGSFRIVQLDLPRLRSSIVLSKGLCRILQRGA